KANINNILKFDLNSFFNKTKLNIQTPIIDKLIIANKNYLLVYINSFIVLFPAFAVLTSSKNQKVQI
ncbi:hypothetical protein R4L75_11665, partial [Brachyspira pilosicoli]|uniref:hypothetical protein n=1 Tax=Brachyspira pilosicoli TaxID=52584 RepID=UPI003004CBB2